MEESRLLTKARGLVEKEEMREWETRHSRDKKKKKGDVGTEKEKEKEEGERLDNFFSVIHEFLVSSNAPTNVFVPVELPARYAIDLVPAAPVVNPVMSSSVVVSSVNFVVSSVNLFLLVLSQTHSYVL